MTNEVVLLDNQNVGNIAEEELPELVKETSSV
jgi:hypothetical protein